MLEAWGVVVVVLSSLAWGGQLLAWLAPATATRLGVMEAEDDIDPSFWADVRGEAVWDALTLWTMVVAGALLVVDADAWPYFGLAGGGMYLYFAGRGLLTRASLLRRGVPIGSPANVRSALSLLTVWGLMALVTIAAAAAELS